MAYLGNAPARNFISFERQVFTIVNSQTVYTLDHSVSNENDIRLVINNVVQQPGSSYAYTASGNTLTIASALTNGSDEMYCVYLGRATATVVPASGSVTNAMLVDGAVTSAKINDGEIGLAKLSATGTKDSTTFLRGDNTFAEAGGGKVLQVVQTTKTDVFSVASASYTDITGYSVSITPSSTSSKILVNCSLCFLGNSSATMGYANIVRDSTNIIRGDANGSRVRATMEKTSLHVNEASVSNFMYLDSPSSTSALTYKVQIRNQGSGTLYVNRSTTWTNSAASSTNASTIIAMEIGA